MRVGPVGCAVLFFACDKADTGGRSPDAEVTVPDGAPSEVSAEPGDSRSRCQVDADCTYSQYGGKVSSVQECECARCPQDDEPVNVTTREMEAMAWEQICRGWYVENPCLPAPCPLPPGLVCKEGRCSFSEVLVPFLEPVSLDR